MTSYVSKPKLLLHLLAMLVGLAISIVGFALAPGLGGQIPSVLGALLFSTALVAIARRWLDPKPQVIITSDGIDDRRLKLGLIPWHDVVSIGLDQTAHAQWLTLELTTPEAYLARLPKVQKVLRALNEQINADHLRIRFTDLDQPIDDAFLLIQALLTPTGESAQFE